MEDKRDYQRGRGGKRGRGGRGQGGGGQRGGRGGGQRGGRGGGRGGRGGGGGWKELWKTVPHMDKKLVEEFFKGSQNKDEALGKIIAKDEEAFLQEHFNGDITTTPRQVNPQFSYTEIEGDLFSSSDSLAHCVSEDFSMSKGVAVGFKETFGGVDDLLAQNVTSGGIGVLHRGDRYIYYLVTKERYWHKPSYGNVWSSLRKMAALCKENGVKRLSMPVIACGLDRLRWPIVKEMIQLAFCKLDIAITVYVWKEK